LPLELKGSRTVNFGDEGSTTTARKASKAAFFVFLHFSFFNETEVRKSLQLISENIITKDLFYLSRLQSEHILNVFYRDFCFQSKHGRLNIYSKFIPDDIQILKTDSKCFNSFCEYLSENQKQKGILYLHLYKELETVLQLKYTTNKLKYLSILQLLHIYIQLPEPSYDFENKIIKIENLTLISLPDHLTKELEEELKTKNEDDFDLKTLTNLQVYLESQLLEDFKQLRKISIPIFSDICIDQLLWDHFLLFLTKINTEEYLHLYKEIIAFRNIVGKEDLKLAAQDIFLRYFGSWDKGKDFIVCIGDMEKMRKIKESILDDNITSGLFDIVYVDIFSMLNYCFKLWISVNLIVE